MTNYKVRLAKKYGTKNMNRLYIQTKYLPRYGEFEDIYWKLMVGVTDCKNRKRLEYEWKELEKRLDKYMVLDKITEYT
jgi:hypothetical protein